MNFLHFPFYISFKKIPVFNFCTTRHGGVSLLPFSTCNTGFNTNDKFENIVENRIIVSKRLGIPVENFVLLKQVHSDKIHYVSEKDCRKFLDIPAIEGDAMFTDQSHIAIAVTLADCVGVIIYCPDKNIVGVCHSGWKGTLLNICGKLVDNMVKNCGCDTGKIIAGISPAICKNCYTVGCEIVQSFPSQYSCHIFENQDGWHIDLKGIVVSQLIEKGLEKENIFSSDICTYENTHIFYSHRAEKNTGRFMFGISIF